MATYVVSDFEYLVVNSGYTSRLVKDVSSLRKKMKGMEMGCCEYEGEDCAYCNDLVVYIEDDIWGKGLYNISSDTEEIEKIRKLLSQEDDLRGIIVIRCNSIMKAMSAVRILMEQKYCACFSFDNLYEMKVIEDKILVMRFDCESG